MSLHKLLEEVREAIRPGDEIVHLRDEVISKINEQLKKHSLRARAVPGGSVAKGTFVAGDHDIDIFIRFALEYENDELASLLEPALKPFKPERLHGSRDYFQFDYEGFEIEAIPVLAIEREDQAKNVTDFSPLHAQYFLAKNVEYEQEVRLAKQFCKAAKVYGAESYIRGFSGHVVDLLILHYKSFYDLVKEASRWKAPVIIDLEGHHDDALSAIDQAKHAPLMLVDPVQPYRNAAAAVSLESFTRFIAHCQAFIKNPGAEFFLLEEFSEVQLRNKLIRHAGNAVLMYAHHPEGDKKDVAGARIRKAYERIQAAYARYGFTLVESGWHFTYNDKSLLWFATEEHSLPRLFEREGPPVSAQADAERFREAHNEVREHEGRLYAVVQRDVREPQHVIEALHHDLEKHTRVEVTLQDLDEL